MTENFENYYVAYIYIIVPKSALKRLAIINIMFYLAISLQPCHSIL